MKGLVTLTCRVFRHLLFVVAYACGRDGIEHPCEGTGHTGLNMRARMQSHY